MTAETVTANELVSLGIETHSAKNLRRSAPAPKPKEDRHFVTALARGLEVLSCFRHGEVTLSNQELAQLCHLPRSTVSRLTMTLTKLGYLIHVEESGRYRLGTACLALGSALLTRLHHSDRDSQYAAKDYRDKLKALSITVSMSRKGNC